MSNTSKIDNRPTTLDGWVDYIQKVHFRTIDLTLDRVAVVAEKLGLALSKEQRERGDGRIVAQHIITVTGTNGKGSTVATCEALARVKGLKYASFSSPHLIRFNERIRINGVPVDDQTIINALNEIESARGETTITYFEFNALVAFLIFSENDIEAAFLEVGVGGRLDATNIIDADQLIITNVAIDHAAWLGNTKEQIGAEKAGLMRADQSVYYAEIDCPKSVIENAKTVGVNWYRVGVDWQFERIDGNRWQYIDNKVEWLLPNPRLQGEHQLSNAAVAIKTFSDYLSIRHLELSEEEVASALQQQFLPGRLDIREIDERSWLFEVGHNPAAIKVVGEYLKQRQVNDATAIITFLADKDAQSMLEVLAPYVGRWIGVSLDLERGRSVESITELLSEYEHVSVVNGADAALEAVKSQQLAKKDVLVIGSFYLVGDIMRALGQPVYPV